MKAAQGRSYHLEVFVDIRIFEVVHFVYHSYGALDYGVSAQCTGAFAQAHA